MISVSSVVGWTREQVDVTTPDGTVTYGVYTESGSLIWRATVRDPEGAAALRIVTMYDGVWVITSVAPVNEDTPIPAWPISARQNPHWRYGALLEIDAPAGCTVTDIWPDQERDQGTGT